jgi:hypothetical protein
VAATVVDWSVEPCPRVVTNPIPCRIIIKLNLCDFWRLQEEVFIGPAQPT